jgi:hypothetical protein
MAQEKSHSLKKAGVVVNNQEVVDKIVMRGKRPHQYAIEWTASVSV